MNSTSEVKELCIGVGAFIVAGVLGFFTLMMAGCTPSLVPLSNATGEAITRAEVRGGSALTHVNAAKPETTPKGLVHLDTAAVELTSQKTDLSDARKALDAERKNAAAWETKYWSLDRTWYVWVGRRIQVLLIVAAIAWVGAGVAGVFLGPIGVTVLNMLPLAGPWHWLRERRLSPL